MHGVIGDFERHLDRVPRARGDAPRIVALLGGTIGNFLPGTRRRLLREIGKLLGPRDRLLLGTDLVKDPRGDRGRLRRLARASPPSSTATCCA